MTALRTAKRASAPAKRERDPYARLILAVGILVAGFVVFLPTKQLVSQHMRIGRLEDRLAALQAENTALEQEVARLDDPAELEVEARERLGLVKPGERLWVLVPPETAPPSESEAVVERGSPWWERAWHAVVRFVKGG